MKYTVEKFITLILDRTITGPSTPIFLFGTPGSGKTDLLSHLAYLGEVLGRKVQNINTEDLITDMVQHIGAGLNKTFRAGFYNTPLDIFILDDISLIAGKDSTQQEVGKILSGISGIVVVASQVPVEYFNDLGLKFEVATIAVDENGDRYIEF